MIERPLHPPRRGETPLHLAEPDASGVVLAYVDQRRRFRMVDVEQVGLEAVALRDVTSLGHDRGRLAVAAVHVMPEGDVGAPRDLHQRRDFRRCHYGIDASHEATRGLALGIPIDVVEQDRRRLYSYVEIALAIEQFVQATRARLEIRIVRTPEQQQNQERGARPELAFAIEALRRFLAEEAVERGQPSVERGK